MKKIRDEQKGIIFIALIILVIAVVSVIFGVSLKSDFVKETLKDNQIVRVLFVVEDSDSSVLFSNLMIFDHQTKRAALVNLPGHVGSIFRSIGRTDKLKVIYEEVGIKSFKTEVEKLLGVSIPFYCVITLPDFLKMADYLGGFRVFIPEPIDYVSEISGERWLLPSGAVNLDGDKINTYLHYKLADENEADLQERYQNVMSAFITSLHDKKFVIFSKGSDKLYTQWFQTNVEEEEEKTLFEQIADVDSESIIKQTVSGSLRNVDGQLLLFPSTNGDLIKESVKQITSMLVSTDGTISSRVYVLRILNGTKVLGLARNTSILFQNASYDVLTIGNAETDYDETVIIDHYGNEDVAKMVGEFIHCTNIKQAEESLGTDASGAEASIDFTIILGKDFDGRYVVPSKR